MFGEQRKEICVACGRMPILDLSLFVNTAPMELNEFICLMPLPNPRIRPAAEPFRGAIRCLTQPAAWPKRLCGGSLPARPPNSDQIYIPSHAVGISGILSSALLGYMTTTCV